MMDLLDAVNVYRFDGHVCLYLDGVGELRLREEHADEVAELVDDMGDNYHDLAEELRDL